MDDAKARQLFEQIAGHPQVKAFIDQEVIKRSKENRKEFGERTWKNAQRQLARQHGFRGTKELRQFLTETGHPFLEAS